MKTKPSKSEQRIAALVRHHEMYGDYNQGESQSHAFMAANGHPYAEEYRKLRAIFDSLRYACNSSARFYTYVDEGEYTEYWAPSLEVSWEPGGDLGKQFPRVYPALDERWEQYLEACATAGWPEECEPGIRHGSFIVRTRNCRLIACLFVALEGKMKVPEAEDGVWDLGHVYPKNFVQAMSCFKAIDKVAGKGKIDRLSQE